MMISQRSIFDDVMERRFSISRENKGMWIVGIIILLGGCGHVAPFPIPYQWKGDVREAGGFFWIIISRWFIVL